jgi:hypothetical protein
MGHGSMPHAIVVAHGGGWATPCRRWWQCIPHDDILTIVAHGGKYWNRRGPRRPPWATANGCQKCKIFKTIVYFCKKILKKYKKISIRLGKERGKAHLSEQELGHWASERRMSIRPQTSNLFYFFNFGKIDAHNFFVKYIPSPPFERTAPSCLKRRLQHESSFETAVWCGLASGHEPPLQMADGATATWNDGWSLNRRRLPVFVAALWLWRCATGTVLWKGRCSFFNRKFFH